ncbi:uncharacterized protein BDW43DRAFT_316418 [Aspergillus alliaceus]|uniref:uncharacterized protein n=1 Tax=Petromyces alliaceus TaxID=209559 RepID=UPI0012A6C6DA|nr:uncharacterized protein BDW43DRAFT_316418 [Aspergillus alliaceus]KAB8227909.1 hypothetical protein BDW43DRAFT_316418 [Aspergillus alliaceus]
MPFMHPFPGSVKAKLISTRDCRAHWIITFTQLNYRISASCTRTGVEWIEDNDLEVSHTIEYHMMEGCPGAEEIKSFILLPEHLRRMPPQVCPCVTWTWYIIWDLNRRHYIEDVSCDNVPIQQLNDKLINIQSELYGSV